MFRDIEHRHRAQSQEKHQDETNHHGNEAGIHLEDAKVIDHPIEGDHPMEGDHPIEGDHQEGDQGAPGHHHVIASHHQRGLGKISHFQILLHLPFKVDA